MPTVKELKAQLGAKGLSVDGLKAELEKRLASSSEAPAEEEAEAKTETPESSVPADAEPPAQAAEEESATEGADPQAALDSERQPRRALPLLLSRHWARRARSAALEAKLKVLEARLGEKAFYRPLFFTATLHLVFLRIVRDACWCGGFAGQGRCTREEAQQRGGGSNNSAWANFNPPPIPKGASGKTFTDEEWAGMTEEEKKAHVASKKNTADANKKQKGGGKGKGKGKGKGSAGAKGSGKGGASWGKGSPQMMGMKGVPPPATNATNSFPPLPFPRRVFR
jgi:hypothetical protein